MRLSDVGDLLREDLREQCRRRRGVLVEGCAIDLRHPCKCRDGNAVDLVVLGDVEHG